MIFQHHLDLLLHFDQVQLYQTLFKSSYLIKNLHYFHLQLVIGIPIFNVTFCIGLLYKQEFLYKKQKEELFIYAVGKINFTYGSDFEMRYILNASCQLPLKNKHHLIFMYIEKIK